MSTSQPIEVRDMAMIHRVFRQSYEEAARLVRANPTPSSGRVTFLADHVDLLLRRLHGHHQDEDELLYPKLIARAPEQAAVTERVVGKVGSSVLVGGNEEKEDRTVADLAFDKGLGTVSSEQTGAE